MLKEACERAAVRPKQLQELFSQYDQVPGTHAQHARACLRGCVRTQDGSGTIAYDELTAMIREFQLEVKGRDVVAELIDDLSDGRGSMSLEEFTQKVCLDSSEG